MRGARSGGTLRRTGAAAHRFVIMRTQAKSELAQKRLSSIKIAGHGTGNTVVLEAEAVGVIREAADRITQDIAAVVML